MTIANVKAIPVQLPVRPLEEGCPAPSVSNHDEAEPVDRMQIRVEANDVFIGWDELFGALTPFETTKADHDRCVTGERYWMDE